MFEIGQEVYVIYKIKNKRGVHKWHVSDKVKIIDNKNKYFFQSNPFKAKRNQIFATYEEAKRKCEYYNHWGKYHKGNNFRGRRKKHK